MSRLQQIAFGRQGSLQVMEKLPQIRPPPGFTIILSVGDQESDLKGGYAERTFKLPNPVYYLP